MLFVIVGLVSFFKTKSNITINTELLESKKLAASTEAKVVVKEEIKKEVIQKKSMRVEDVFTRDGKNIAFLTFDDGPSKENTEKILDILKEQDVKATFFVLGSNAKKNPEIVKKMVNEGHAIGNHTYSHDYDEIYSDVEIFMGEIDKTNSVLKEIFGEDFSTRLVRFPSGSFGSSKEAFRQEVTNKGYAYIDWNVVTGDGENEGATKEELINKFIATKEDKRHVVVLMHDSPSKKTSVEALPEIIHMLKAQGYEFSILE